MSNPLSRARDLRDHLHNLNPYCLAIAAAWGFRSAVQIDIEVRVVDGKPAATRLIFTRLDKCPAVEDAERAKRADLALRHIEAQRDHDNACDDALELFDRMVNNRQPQRGYTPATIAASINPLRTVTGRLPSTINLQELSNVRDE